MPNGKRLFPGGKADFHGAWTIADWLIDSENAIATIAGQITKIGSYI